MKKRNSLFAILLIVSMFTLTACGSKEVVEAVNETETVAVEESVTKEPVVEASETVVAEEAVTDTIAQEPEKELYIPKGIDMESTLPGEDWVASFAGNVNEPVAVVFNDNTGRKEVIQGKSEVLINPKEDRIGLFLNEEDMGFTLYQISPKDLINGDSYSVIIIDPVEQREFVDTEAGFHIYSGDEECGFIEFELILTEETIAITDAEKTVIVQEPEKELYIPKGIDMESILPGEEWVASFAGNVNEPVAVVFNDNTGRKEVIQGKSEVLINPEEDRIALFLSEENMSSMLYKIHPKELIDGDSYTVIIIDPEKQKETEAGFMIYSGDEEWGPLEFEIILE